MTRLRGLPDFDPADGIHVFVFSTQPIAGRWGECERWLSRAETQRARAIRKASSRAGFTVTRAMLRLVLARAIGIAPQSLSFEYGPSGKPAIARSSMQFNVTHSGALAAIALGYEHCVGVDIERSRLLPRVGDLLQFACSGDERREVLALPEQYRAGAFLQCWTRKEAVLKALGWGLSCLSRVEVGVSAARARGYGISRQGGAQSPDTLRLVDLTLPSGYFGALATGASDETPTTYHSLSEATLVNS